MSALEIGVAQAKSSFSEIMGRAAYGGQQFIILSRGKPLDAPWKKSTKWPATPSARTVPACANTADRSFSCSGSSLRPIQLQKEAQV